MRTANESKRGRLSASGDAALPILACLALLAASCGGGSGSKPPIAGEPDPGGIPEAPLPPAPAPLAAPAIAAVDPAIGPPAGGTALTIIGSGFQEGITGPVSVRIGSKDALDVAVNDDTTITCKTPQGTPETAVDILVENSRGIAVLEQGFSYLALPTVNTDLDDDGIADIVISARFDSTTGQYAGSVYVFYGVAPPEFLLDMSASAANVKLMGADAGDRFGSAVASGDVNGDGKDDLVVGASHVDETGLNAGAVYVFFGPLPDSGELSAVQADVLLTGAGAADDEQFGTAVAVGDVDSDLIEDILVGATGVDFEAGPEQALVDVGAAYLFEGSLELGDSTASAALHVWRGDEEEDRLGNSCLIADVNGDQLADVIVGAHLSNPYLPPKKYDAGSVHVFFAGPELSGGRAADADVIYTGEEPSDEFGSSLASGDMNGDGIADLMASAPGSQALGSETGRAYVFLGSTAPTGLNASVADGIYSGQQSNGDFGRDLTASDFNGDGLDDVAIGAPHNSFGATKNGRCYVFLGAPELEDGLAHFADLIYTGEFQNGERFGSSVEVIDLAADGLADVISAALGNSNGGIGSGRVYVFEGEQVPTDENAVDGDLTLTGEAPEGNFGSSISRGR